MSNPLTLVNKQTGNLDLKLFEFKGSNHFNHIQRLGYYSIIWIKKGTGTAKVGITDYSFSDEVIFSFTPYQPFMFEVDESVEGVVINFHPDFFCIHHHQEQIACNGVLFNNLYNPPYFLPDDESKGEFEKTIAQMQKEIENSSLAQNELLVSYLKIFLIGASRLKLDQQKESEKSKTTVSDAPVVLQNLKSLIEANYKTKHSASEYADLLNITPKALGKVTKEYYDRTLTDLITERIIIEAKRELYLTNKTVKEIAYDLGYSDEHYFSRFFKNKADVSPKFYRETIGAGRGVVN